MDGGTDVTFHSLYYFHFVCLLSQNKENILLFFALFVEQNRELGSQSCCFNCVALTKSVSLCLYVLSHGMGIIIALILCRIGRGK